MIEFNDDYKSPRVDVFGNSKTDWVLEEKSSSILENRRKELGMTQQQVADKAQIQLRQYQRFENGERELYSSSMRIGVAICCVLKLDPCRFIGKTFK